MNRRRIPLVVAILGVLWPQLTPAEPRTEMVRGELVAYDAWSRMLPCYHVCGVSVLLRIEASPDEPARFVRVAFTYQDKKFPTRLVATSRVLRLDVVRDTEFDGVLEQYVQALDPAGRPADVKVPIWRAVRGAESVELPFGTRVDGYRFDGNLSDLTGEKGQARSRGTTRLAREAMPN